MNLWYCEYHTKHVRFELEVQDVLYNGQSEYQKISVLQTTEFGRVLVLDGFLMLTEQDEFIYHEMMTHVPLAVNPEVKSVLIVGGGDGGAARELVRYDTIQRIDLVDIDKQVVDISRKYLPFTACGLNDERVNIFYEDGLKFVRGKQGEYDLIIVDSTDPFGPGEGLYTLEFYGNCYNALKGDGMLINQHESVYYPSYHTESCRMHKRIARIFPIHRVYQAHIATYPSGHWLFGFASKKYEPVQHFDAQRWENLNMRPKYYNTALHTGCFALPTYVREILAADE